MIKIKDIWLNNINKNFKNWEKKSFIEKINKIRSKNNFII